MLKWLYSVLLVLVLPTSLALTVNPQEYRIQELEQDRTYQIVATVINSDLSAQDISIILDRDSQYLAEFINIQDRFFQLQPNDKRNVRIALMVPEGRLSPEEHVAVFSVMSGTYKLGEFRIRFSIAGDKIQSLIITGVHAEDTPRDKPFFIFVGIKNEGNVIARIRPVIEIFDGSRIVDRFGEESRIMVMPGEDYNLTLMYDLTGLQNKEYVFSVSLLYNENMSAGPKSVRLSVLPSLNVQTENYLLREGENLSIIIELENTLDRRSFYNVVYSIEGANISGKLEGEFSEPYKKLDFQVETSALPAGEYVINIETRTGQSLERLESQRIILTVKGKSLAVYYAVITIIVILSIGISSAVGYKWFRERAGKPSLEKVESKLRKTKRVFSRTEEDFRQLSNQVVRFMQESNDWLDSRYGRGRYGFK